MHPSLHPITQSKKQNLSPEEHSGFVGPQAGVGPGDPGAGEGLGEVEYGGVVPGAGDGLGEVEYGGVVPGAGDGLGEVEYGGVVSGAGGELEYGWGMTKMPGSIKAGRRKKRTVMVMLLLDVTQDFKKISLFLCPEDHTVDMLYAKQLLPYSLLLDS